MDLLIVEPLEPEVVQWLSSRYSVQYAPELARDPRAFRQALYDARSIIIPPSLALDSQALHHAPALRLVGRVSAGIDNIDLDACSRAGVEVVRSVTASAQAEAEFMIGAVLSLMRRVPVPSADGLLVGRELSAATVGLVGMAPAARSMAHLLSSFGSRVIGYDPSVHASDRVWGRWKVKPYGLRELIEDSDAVCVQLSNYSRYRGLLGDRLLPFCKQNQVIVSISHSSLFDEQVLADVMASGRVSAAWFDNIEAGALDQGRPLSTIETLQITPRVASTTRESRLRSSWAVVKRVDELLSLLLAEEAEEFEHTRPGVALDLADLPASQ